jgi:UDP-N-acetylmuramate dehydrogenase
MSVEMTIDRPAILDRLPKVRGRYNVNVALADQTWFRVGGPADVVFRPTDLDDLTAFLRATPADVPVTVIGVGSNLLVRDGGVRGVVIRLGRDLARVEIEGDVVAAGAGAPDINVSLAARDASLSGLEFLRGIPGTIGGAVRMNAGAYGSEIKDVLIEAEAVDRAGAVHRVGAADLRLTYRHSGAPADWIFTRAWLRATPGDKAAIQTRMNEISEARETSQPVRSRTGGSTFANPEGARAWELIDKAGCRGLRVGGAMVSEQHCNFLINTGEATAADLETLGETVRRRVKATSGVDLRWEIQRIGEAAA